MSTFKGISTALFLILTLVSGSASARWVSTDPVQANPDNGQNFNRYYYANNNPYRFTDPDGRRPCEGTRCQIEISRQSLGNESADAMLQQANAVDEIKTAVLAVKIMGQIFLSQFEDGPGGAIAGAPAALTRGIASEARVLKSIEEVKNTEKVVTSQGRTIPDFQNARQVGEIKDTKRVTDSAQLRAQREHAQATGREHTVVTGTNTKVSGTVEQQSTVIRRDDLGPRK